MAYERLPCFQQIYAVELHSFTTIEIACAEAFPPQTANIDNSRASVLPSATGCISP